MSAAKVERLLNLSAALLAAERPLTAADIARRVPGYPEDQASFRRAFERDKDDLRQMGIPLRLAKVMVDGQPTDGYRIPPEEYALRDPHLEPEELAALHFAVHTVRLEGLSSAEAMDRLAGERLEGPAPTFDDADGVGPVATVPADARLTSLFGALIDRHPVRFTYNGLTRVMEPYRLDFERGRWYLSGFDRQRGENRSFRVERMEGEPTVTVAETFQRPAQPHPGVTLRSWQLGGGDPVWAELAIDPDQAAAARNDLGADSEIGIDADGRVRFRVEVRNPDAFRGLVLTFLDHAEVMSPPELRADVVAWLQAMVGSGES
ncbi:MAG: helix-turn-helix transcriptional regulator [Acidimicrobiales bacterium]